MLHACDTAERAERRAENALSIGEYAEAAALYRQAYQRTPTKNRLKRGQLCFNMGEAYRRYGNTARALAAYKNAERYKYTDTVTYIRIGDMLCSQGDYNGAVTSYQAYLDLHPDDVDALQGLKAAQMAPTLKDSGSYYTVKPVALFNSSRADYSPALLGTDAEQIYFSTTRNQVEGGSISGITAMKPGDIYYAKRDENGQWKRPEPADESLNTEDDEGACCFDKEGKTMYFTVCKTDGRYPRMAEIYMSKRTDAQWGKAQPLKITADTLSSYAHPALSPDGQYLYFTSDMPGGFGGLDLWRVRIEKGTPTNLENLGPDINTKGNECFPTFRPNGDLYFSSDNRLPNLGGLDLYKARQQGERLNWTVEPLPAPMNSNGDDFGMTFEGLHNQGYFSSSRATGGRGWDKIFSFSYPEYLQSVKGWVYEQDGYELPAAQVYMVGTDGTNKKIGLRTDGSFEEPLEPGVRYLFLAACDGFLNILNQLQTESREIEMQYVLQFPLPNINMPVLIRGINYEFDKAVITDSSTVALNRLVKLLQENPNVTIELAAHTDYRGSDAYNQRLSQARAQNVVNYLINQGIDRNRLTAVGYGKTRPVVVSKKLHEQYLFLNVGDTLNVQTIERLYPAQQEVANALNRRTEFRVLNTTFGLFDEKGNLKQLPPAKKHEEDTDFNADDNAGEWY
ncbi:MAG: OmpA family protein [Alloprevotella sp.]|nr:OmpA family protein [Alloprevotella sp.]